MLGEDDGMGDMDSTEAEVFDWDAFREQCVNALVSSLGMDLRPLWPMGAPDEVRTRSSSENSLAVVRVARVEERGCWVGGWGEVSCMPCSHMRAKGI